MEIEIMFRQENQIPKKKQSRKQPDLEQFEDQLFQQNLPKQSDFDESLIQQFSKLKDCLSENNYTNIGNLQRLNVNLSTLFDYVRDGFRCMINKIQQNRQTINELRRILSQNNIPYKYTEADNQITNQIEQINQRMLQEIAYKNQINPHTANLKRRKPKQLKLNDHHLSTKRIFDSWNTIKERQQPKNQYSMAINFVNHHLKDKIQYDPDKNFILPKNSVLNLYVQWIEKNTGNGVYGNLSLIQMGLTNELKRIFPKIQHNHKTFKGLRFKQQYKQYTNLTDVQINKGEDESAYDPQDSPPLPIFEEQD